MTQDILCGNCGRYIVSKSNLRRHQRGKKCRALTLARSLEAKGMVQICGHTADLLRLSGIPVESRMTRYHYGLHSEWWAQKIAGLVGGYVRLMCSSPNRIRKLVISDIMANETAKACILLGADPNPFVEDAIVRVRGKRKKWEH